MVPVTGMVIMIINGLNNGDMKFFNVLYFYYYLFYLKILKDAQPVFTATFSFSFSISLLVNGVLNIILALALNENLNKWGMISIFLAFLILSYFYYNRKGKAEEIFRHKPKFYNSNVLSIILTILFFILCVSFLFWEPIYSKNIIEGK
jgi:uncharacterized membrane protein HdeD (DUF308 family)